MRIDIYDQTINLSKEADLGDGLGPELILSCGRYKDLELNDYQAKVLIHQLWDLLASFMATECGVESEKLTLKALSQDSFVSSHLVIELSNLAAARRLLAVRFDLSANKSEVVE